MRVWHEWAGLSANRNPENAGRRRANKDTIGVKTRHRGAKAQRARSVDSKLNSKNSTLPFPVSSLTWDHFIYPRAGKSDKTISAYVEALAIGAQFPPIKIQRVFNYPSSPPFSKGGKGGFSDQTTDLPAGRHGAIIIIDGIHRWFAFKEKGIKEIAAVDVQRRRLRRVMEGQTP